jgi:Lar family restriction alleviation protein
MSELNPCPFCGKTKLIRLETDFHPDRPQCNWTARVVCLDCFGEARSHGFEWTEQEAKEKATAAWNRRAQPKNETLTCDGCRWKESI